MEAVVDIRLETRIDMAVVELTVEDEEDLVCETRGEIGYKDMMEKWVDTHHR